MAAAVAEDPSCPHVKGRLDSKTSIEKEGRKPENVYGLPLTGGREGVLPLTWLTLGQTVMEMDAGNWSIFLLIGGRNFTLL